MDKNLTMIKTAAKIGSKLKRFALTTALAGYGTHKALDTYRTNKLRKEFTVQQGYDPLSEYEKQLQQSKGALKQYEGQLMASGNLNPMHKMIPFTAPDPQYRQLRSQYTNAKRSYNLAKKQLLDSYYATNPDAAKKDMLATAVGGTAGYFLLRKMLKRK